MRNMGIIASGNFGYDPSTYGMTFQNLWWAQDPAHGYADGATVTDVIPYVTGPDTLAHVGAGTTTFRTTSASMNNRSVFECATTARLAKTLTSTAQGGVIVFRQRTVVSNGGLVASGANTRVRNSGTTGYQMRYNGGTALTYATAPDTSAHILAWYFNDSGNEIMNIDGTEVINAASADSASGMIAIMLNYDNTTYGNSDYALACVTSGNPTADGSWAAFLAATKTYYGIA